MLDFYIALLKKLYDALPRRLQKPYALTVMLITAIGVGIWTQVQKMRRQKAH